MSKRRQEQISIVKHLEYESRAGIVGLRYYSVFGTLFAKNLPMQFLRTVPEPQGKRVMGSREN